MVRNKLPLAFLRDAKTSQTFTRAERFYLDLRRILRKGVSFNPLSQEQVNLIMSHLNSYPRPSLGGRTPYDLFVEEFGDEGKRFLDRLGIVRIQETCVHGGASARSDKGICQKLSDKLALTSRTCV